jgi:hypothetical protein
MKHLTSWTLLLFAIFSTTFLVAQNKSADQLVEDFLGSPRYENSLANNPGMIDYLKIKSKEGYHIDTIPSEKITSYESLPPVFYMKNEISVNQFITDVNSPDFNFLKYSFPTIDKGKYVLNTNDNTIITIHSNQYINRKIRRNK